MSYATLLVHLEIGQSNANLLNVTGDLAGRFGANVVGIAARQAVPVMYGDGYPTGALYEQYRQDTERLIAQTQQEFQSALQLRVSQLAWRSTLVYESLSDYLAQEARSTDLVITGVAEGDWFAADARINVGDLLMRVGRPVLVVPPQVSELRLEWAVLAWKDTREARRAAVDALPLLKKAVQVSIIEVAQKDDLAAAELRVADVANWLLHHGIKASTLVSPANDEGDGQLVSLAKAQGADVIVAGAYGHSRPREWIFGGVTRDLMKRANCCLLLSH
jgi:nucleotide-binding universal stress UspA family protein